MATMSGVVVPPAPGPRSNGPLADEDELFATALVVSNPPPARPWFGLRASLAAHVLLIGSLVLVPVLWPSPSPEHPDYIRALIYNPPPPPPPPLPKGSALVQKVERPKPVTPEQKPEKPKLTAEIEVPKEQELRPEARARDTEQAGSPTGSDIGVPEGMEGGVEGGVVGGVPGGVIGGVVGGTGDGPVLDYDQPPRPIKMSRPQYPQEAFVKKIEGTVVVEILIDATGHVIRARVIKSVPALDQAAVQTVYQWLFYPAVKRGRPVATIAQAPVSFQIF
jgi:protein TonB